MNYNNPQIAAVAEQLTQRFQELSNKADILRAVELKALFEQLKTLPADQRAAFGQEVNQLQNLLRELVADQQDQSQVLPPIDVTAPVDINVPRDKQPQLMGGENGTRHPLMSELEKVLDIFYRMGFSAVENRELDDDYHMFGSLNFPEGHPARDDFDTFNTVQTDKDGKPFIAPAHTTAMDNRDLKKYAANLEAGQPIAVVNCGRVFRNEDVDARHEHTFYQFDGVYIDKGVNTGMLMATLKTFLEEYYGKAIEVKTQPFYFPFTEPSFEFALSCPFCDKKGCNICSYSGWIELLGCGMLHPNVLREGGIDPEIYTGFAWGCGLERLVMMKYGIEDVRHFEAARLEFLRQFV
jgi:phenylalanyl-tRNA synthetase alpha chain